MADPDVEIRRALERLTPVEVDTGGVTDAVLSRHARRHRRRTVGAGLAAVCVAVLAGLGLATLVGSDTRQVVTGPGDLVGERIWLVPTWVPDGLELHRVIDHEMGFEETLAQADFGGFDDDGWLIWEAFVTVSPFPPADLDHAELIEAARGEVHVTRGDEPGGYTTVAWSHGSNWVAVGVSGLDRDVAVGLGDRVQVQESPTWEITIPGEERLGPTRHSVGEFTWLDYTWHRPRGREGEAPSGPYLYLHVYDGMHPDTALTARADEQPRHIRVRDREGLLRTRRSGELLVDWVERPGTKVTIQAGGFDLDVLVRFADGLRAASEDEWEAFLATSHYREVVLADGESGPFRWKRTAWAHDPDDARAIVYAPHPRGHEQRFAPPSLAGSWDSVGNHGVVVVAVTVDEPIDAIVLVLGDGTELAIGHGPSSDPQMHTIGELWGDERRSYWALFDEEPPWVEIRVRTAAGEERTLGYHLAR